MRRFDAEWQAKLPPKSKLLSSTSEETGKISADFGADKALINRLTSLQTSSQNESPTLILSNYVPQDDSRNAQFRYRSYIEEGHIIIQPDDPYLDAVRNSGEIGSLDFSPWSCEFAFPALDVKLVNNTRQTLFFHQAIFQIKKSRLDPRPVPVIKTGYDMMLPPLENIGWGSMEDCVLRFTIVNSRDKNSYGTRSNRTSAIQYPFELKFGNVDERVPRNLSLASFFEQAGVNTKQLKALWSHITIKSQWVYFDEDSELGEPCVVDDPHLPFEQKGRGMKRLLLTEYEAMVREALGPFPFGSATRLGELEYGQIDSEGNKSRQMNRVTAVVNIHNDLPVGANTPPSYSYNVRFQVEGENYKRIVPISHSLSVGTTDRFLFYIAADKSSLHDFDLVLRYNDSEQIQSKPIELELFLSRRDAPF